MQESGQEPGLQECGGRVFQWAVSRIWKPNRSKGQVPGRSGWGDRGNLEFQKVGQGSGELFMELCKDVFHPPNAQGENGLILQIKKLKVREAKGTWLGLKARSNVVIPGVPPAPTQ
jgi:hypothetical protein